MKYLAQLVLIVWWVHGLVVAQGFWLTLFSIIPFVGWIVSMNWFITQFQIGCI